MGEATTALTWGKILQEVYAHREEIPKLWDKLAQILWRRKVPIAITGSRGVGKTALFDYLTKRARQEGYRPPGESIGPDHGERNTGVRRIELTVVPSQESAQREKALEEAFVNSPVEGLVHVVCNGYHDLRDEFLKKQYVIQGLKQASQFCERMMEVEIRQLPRLCELIRASLKAHGKPTWMIVAVAKVDLYHDQMSDAEAWYSQHSNSSFAKTLNDFRDSIGRNQFIWQ